MKIIILPVFFLFFSCFSSAKVRDTPGITLIEFRVAEDGGKDEMLSVMSVTDYKVSKIYDEYGRFSILITLTSENAQKFAEVSSANIGKYLSLTSGDTEIITAVIMDKISDGRMMITFSTHEEADRIYLILCGRQP